jgi:alanine racemase
MIDLTECPEAQHDDEVVLIGEQGQNTISVSSFAELSDLLNYELLTRLPANTPRRIVNRNNTALPFLEQTPTSNGVH